MRGKELVPRIFDDVTKIKGARYVGYLGFLWVLDGEIDFDSRIHLNMTGPQLFPSSMIFSGIVKDE